MPLKNPKFIITDLFDSYVVQMLYKDILRTRKCIGDDNFEYTPQVICKDEIKYLITATHIPLDTIKKYGKGNCSSCFGKGYTIANIAKNKIANVEDYMMISSYDIRNASEEQRKLFIEKEKQKNYWKIIFPCICAVKKMEKKGMQIVHNKMRNIIVELTCTKE